MTELRVLVADDQALLRQSLMTVLELDPGIVAVAEAPNGQAAVEACRDGGFDVVLMDIQMPVMDGIEATRQIVSEHPQTRVVMLTAFEQDEYVYRALRAGASGFLLKDTSPKAIQEAVRAVSMGQALLSPVALRALVQRHTPKVPAAGATVGLTGRQVEILTLVAEGLSNQEIAEHLTISGATLKSHISALLSRLGARDRAQLVIAAYRLGLVGPGKD